MTKNLDELTTEELLQELARRRAGELGDDLTTIEEGIEDAAEVFKQSTLDARIAAMPPEGSAARPCPLCGALARVRRKRVKREVRCLSGVLVVERNHHYCEQCRAGFYPRDRELGLPEEGAVSPAVERRILDLAVNDTFEASAQRWSVHYRWTISENLARRVVDRVGSRVEQTDDVYLHHSLSEPPQELSRLVLVQNDGSLLPTREGWREAKMAVVVRAENHLRGQGVRRGEVSQARYVAVVGEQQEFKEALSSALRVEKALRAERVVWIADGALGNWRLADELAPGCTQILDWYHAIEHAVACGKALLGETERLVSVWQSRCEHLMGSVGVEKLIDELLECLPLADDEGAKAINDLVRYYRNNTTRMRYADFIAAGFPIGNGTAESSHRHVLQTRMKRAGQRWSLPRARRMARLRAAYRTAGPKRFHRALRVAAEATRVHPIQRRNRAKASNA